MKNEKTHSRPEDLKNGKHDPNIKNGKGNKITFFKKSFKTETDLNIKKKNENEIWTKHIEKHI